MNTAQIIYEQYKVLPKRGRQELKKLTISEEEAEKPLSLIEELIREGKLPRRTFDDLKREIQDGK